MANRSGKSFRCGGALLALYAFVYLLLSLNGRYEPIDWGVRGPKGYMWAPAGFVDDLKWRKPMIGTFLPFWEIDRFIWHSEERMYDGKLPVNKIAEQDGPATGSQPIHSDTNQASGPAR